MITTMCLIFSRPGAVAGRCAFWDDAHPAAATSAASSAAPRPNLLARIVGVLPSTEDDFDLFAGSDYGVWLWHAAAPHSFGITPVMRNDVICSRSCALPRPKPC